MSLLMDALKRAEKARGAEAGRDATRDHQADDVLATGAEPRQELSLDPIEMSEDAAELSALGEERTDSGSSSLDRISGAELASSADEDGLDAPDAADVTEGSTIPALSRPLADASLSDASLSSAFEPGFDDSQAVERELRGLRGEHGAETGATTTGSSFSLLDTDDGVSFSDTSATLPSIKAARRSVDDYFDGSTSISSALDEMDESQLRDLDASLTDAGDLEDAKNASTTQRRARTVLSANARRARSRGTKKFLLAVLPLLFTAVVGASIYFYWSTVERVFFSGPSVVSNRPLPQPLPTTETPNAANIGALADAGAAPGSVGESNIGTDTTNANRVSSANNLSTSRTDSASGAPVSENRVEQLLLSAADSPTATVSQSTTVAGSSGQVTNVEAELTADSEDAVTRGVVANLERGTAPGGLTRDTLAESRSSLNDASPAAASLSGDAPDVVRAAMAARQRFQESAQQGTASSSSSGRLTSADSGQPAASEGATIRARPPQGSARGAPPSQSRQARSTSPSEVDDGLRIAKRSRPNRVSRLLLDAYEDFQRGDLEAALRGYRRVLARDRRSRDALLGLAAIQVQRGLSEQAGEIYARLLRLNPRDSAAHAGLIALTENVDPVAGESRIKTMLQREPTQSYLHFNLGNLYARQSRWPEAQKAYFDAYRLDDENPDYAFNLAVSLDQLSQAKSARQYYQRALELSANRFASFDGRAVQTRLAAMSP